VCNLGSLVLENHIREDGSLDHALLKETITVAVRALDNVIDINFYPTKAASTSNQRHRPIGLGVMGLQNALFKKNLPFSSSAAVEFNDEFMEAIAYYAYSASSDLASERGTYQSYEGSKWDRGILPQDSIDLLEQERGMKINVPRGHKMDWTPVREKIVKNGMRNSNVLAIAPTATISNIMGTTPCIEPNYKNFFTKSNLSGNFLVLNRDLVEDLKSEGLWGREMLDRLKYHDGELDDIPEISARLKLKYKTVFGVPFEAVIDAAARRQKWIDQSQSVNLFLATPDLKVLSHMYRHAWHSGLKTTYYLRTLGASGVEKSTVDVKKETRGVVANLNTAKSSSSSSVE
jgi:ribonucleoside-diphosphate reductase alpha chain